MNMYDLDKAILTTFPVAGIGPQGSYETATKFGVRYLLSATGIWREINLPWLFARIEIGQVDAEGTPFGQTQELIEFKMGAMPLQLITEFTVQAKKSPNTEIAAALLWNERTEEWRLATRVPISASGAHIHYQEVRLEEGEHMVVDMHSHGHHDAFFSREDNNDDLGSMKVSMVVGNCDKPVPNYLMRLCLIDRSRLIDIGEDGCLNAGE